MCAFPVVGELSAVFVGPEIDVLGFDRTLGELGGTGKRTISVGNYTTRNVWTNFSGKKQSMLIDYPLNKINYTSSRGPASDGRVKPDVTAPGGMIFSSVSSYSDYYKESSANTVARAVFFKISCISSGDSSGFASNHVAMTPATKGEACDVPVICPQ